MPPTVKPRKTQLPWDDGYYVKAYRLAKSGLSDQEILRNLLPRTGRSDGFRTWRRWLEQRPALAAAVAQGREEARGEGGAWDGLKDHVYHSLDDEARAVWDQVRGVEDLKSSRSARLLMERQGLRLKQHLFLYALFECDFSRTQACRKLGLNPRAVDNWCQEPGFRKLLKGVHECKKDYAESALFRLIKANDVAAILFANRTLNRDRGYGDRLDVKVQGEVEHKVTLDQLGLPLETRKQLLEAVRRQKALPAPVPVIEGNYKALPNGDV